MQQEMESLKKEVAVCCGKPKSMYDSSAPEETESNTQEKAILYQNTPNPFSSNTEIRCELFAKFSHAAIYIYNLQGLELKSYPISQTGVNTIIVQGAELTAGMYLYSLVIDNEMMDTKRMILTK